MAKAKGYPICKKHLDMLDPQVRERYGALYGFDMKPEMKQDDKLDVSAIKYDEAEECIWCKAEITRKFFQKHT
jgi:hypothetical protein